MNREIFVVSSEKGVKNFITFNYDLFLERMKMFRYENPNKSFEATHASWNAEQLAAVKNMMKLKQADTEFIVLDLAKHNNKAYVNSGKEEFSRVKAIEFYVKEAENSNQKEICVSLKGISKYEEEQKGATNEK